MTVVKRVGEMVVGWQVVGGVWMCLQGVRGGGEEGADRRVDRRVRQAWGGQRLVGGVWWQ